MRIYEVTERTTAYNSGLAKVAGSVLRMTVLWLIKHEFFKSTFVVKIPALRVAAKR
jgi:hypothetical protein